MKSEIGVFENTTDWTVSDGTKAWIHGLNQIPDYVAGLNSASLILKFSNANGEYAQRLIDKDLTNYSELVFHIWSRNKNRPGWVYREES